MAKKTTKAKSTVYDDAAIEINAVTISGVVNSITEGKNGTVIIRLQQQVQNHLEFHTCFLPWRKCSDRLLQAIMAGDRIICTGRLTNWGSPKTFKKTVISVQSIALLAGMVDLTPQEQNNESEETEGVTVSEQ